MMFRFVCKKFITGNTWALRRALKEGSECNPNDSPALSPIHVVDIFCTPGSRAVPIWAEGAGCSPGRPHTLRAAAANSSISCWSQGRPSLSGVFMPWERGEAAAKEVVWAVWPLVVGLTCWCQPGITGDPWNQECFLLDGCFGWQSSTAHPGVMAEVASTAGEALIFRISERAFSAHGGAIQPFLPCFLLSVCNIAVAAWSVHISCSAAESKRHLSSPAQQKGIDKSYLSGNFSSSYSVLSRFPHLSLKLSYCRNESSW